MSSDVSSVYRFVNNHCYHYDSSYYELLLVVCVS